MVSVKATEGSPSPPTRAGSWERKKKICICQCIARVPATRSDSLSEETVLKGLLTECRQAREQAGSWSTLRIPTERSHSLPKGPRGKGKEQCIRVRRGPGEAASQQELQS